MTPARHDRVRVAVIGGGPAGLTAAAELAPRVRGEVRVIEREVRAGGIPRHSDHPGYGIRDLHRFLSGPEYARRLDRAARAAGATIQTQAMVTDWDEGRTFAVTSPQGRTTVEADAVILATGARERPRSARLIPGDRPAGVFTTGQLQNLVHLNHAEVGRRAVIVGAELVSWSAVLTLREAGCAVALMSTQYDRPESYAAFHVPGRLALRVPVRTRSRLVRINGKPRVESVELEDLDTGERSTVACDTVITTGDWIPDNEVARAAGLEMDRPTRGPRVDPTLATSAPGVFAIGNMVHPVDTADVAALDGRHVAAGVLAFLAGRPAPARGPQLVADPPLRWVSPQYVMPGERPSRDRLLCWTDAFIGLPRVTVTQDGRRIADARVPWTCAPGRVFRVPYSLVAGSSPTGGPVHVSVRQHR